MDIRKVVAWNIRAVRVKQGISQEKLALEAEIDRGYMSRIERGEENFTIARLEAVATVLNVPVRQLFDEPEKGQTMPRLTAGVKPRATKSKTGNKKNS